MNKDFSKVPSRHSTPEVLYEDNHVIAVFKPAGMLVQGDRSGERTLMDWTKDYLIEKYRKPGRAFLGLVHRLDKVVAGIVVFGKTSKGASRISEQIRGHQVEKLYRALVQNTVLEPVHLVHYLEALPDGTMGVFPDPSPRRKRAELELKPLAQLCDRTVLQVRLITGRKHQIRAQLKGIGHPIVGDWKYGASVAYREGAIALVATSFRFQHPVDCTKSVLIELRDEYVGF